MPSWLERINLRDTDLQLGHLHSPSNLLGTRHMYLPSRMERSDVLDAIMLSIVCRVTRHLHSTEYVLLWRWIQRTSLRRS